MELRHLRYLVAVAEELHFGRAAERLYVAQPAVSDQIRKLEAELGVLLLNRTRRTVSLTDAGAALLAEARRVLQQVEAARLALQEVRDGSAGRLRVGYMPASLPASVPRALQQVASSIGGPEGCPGAGARGRVDRGSPQRAPGCRDRLAAGRDQGTSDDATWPRARCRRAARQSSSCGAAGDPPRAGCNGADRRAASRGQPPFLRRCPRRVPEGRRVTVARRDVSDLRGAGAARRGVGCWGSAASGIRGRPLLPARRSVVPIEGDQPVVARAAVTRRESTHLPTAALVRALPNAARPHPRFLPIPGDSCRVIGANAPLGGSIPPINNDGAENVQPLQCRDAQVPR
jgi:hypothetical protein